jgi:secreted trypsin-like serine protease
VRRLILVLAMIGVAVLLASGAAQAITGGWLDDGHADNAQEPSPTNIIKYPNVGALVNRTGAYCSGTLVPGKDLADGTPGPPVFLTAAHCDPNDTLNDPSDGNTAYVTFDYHYVKERSLFPEGPGTEYKGTFYADNTNDIAVVKFDAGSTPPSTITREDGTTQEIPAQLPTFHQLDAAAKGDPFTAVGYGDTSGSSNDYGWRRYAVSTFKSVDPTYLRLSQHNGSGGTCYGDSGGPNFLGTYPYPNDVPVIAGITITGDTWCKATNVTLRLDTESVRKFLSDQGVTVP